MAEAWDGRGKVVFSPPHDHKVLLNLAGLDPDLWSRQWSQLSGSQRSRIVRATRRVFELAGVCAWLYGVE